MSTSDLDEAIAHLVHARDALRAGADAVDEHIAALRRLRALQAVPAMPVHRPLERDVTADPFFFP